MYACIRIVCAYTIYIYIFRGHMLTQFFCCEVGILNKFKFSLSLSHTHPLTHAHSHAWIFAETHLHTRIQHQNSNVFRFVHLLDQYSVENNNKIVIKTTVQITYPVENTLYTTISISSKKFLAFSPRVLSEANISLLGDQNRGLECEGTEKKNYGGLYV